MEEEVKYQVKVSICFSDLNSRIKDTIGAKLLTAPHNQKFKVIDILDFDIKEMMVEDQTVKCSVEVRATALHPKIGQEYSFAEWKKFKDKILISKDGLQILADLPSPHFPSDGSTISVRIDDIRIYADILACVGMVVR